MSLDVLSLFLFFKCFKYCEANILATWLEENDRLETSKLGRINVELAEPEKLNKKSATKNNYDPIGGIGYFDKIRTEK